MARRIQAKKATTRKRYSKEFRDEALALAERLGGAGGSQGTGVVRIYSPTGRFLCF